MKKQSLIKGTFILAAAGIFAKFLGLFFRWPLIMLIGDEGIGYYQMSYPLYTFFIAIASGIPVAISKMVSERNAMGDKEGAFKVLNRAVLLMLFFGGGFSLFLILFSRNLIHFFKWNDKSYYSLLGIAIAPFFIAIMSAFRGFFQGLQNMVPTAISQIIEQLGRVFVGVGLAYLLLPRGIEFSAGGAAFGAAAGGVFGGTYLITQYLRARKDFHLKRVKGNSVILGKLLYIAIPISVGATVGSIMGLIDSFLVPQKLLEAGYTYTQATVLYGQLTGKAFVLINVPLTLSMSLCISLVPIIAEAFILNKRMEIINKVELSIKFAAIIALPCFLGLFFMSAPILDLIFPGHSDGYNILKYLSIAVPFIILAQTCTAILQGVGKYMTPVINLAIGCGIKILMTITLVAIPEINIYGAVIGSVCGYMTAALLNLRALKKTLNISINFYETLIKPGYASAIMIIAVVFIYTNGYNYTKNGKLSCFIAILIGGLLYSLMIFLFGILKYDYVRSRFHRNKSINHK